MSETSPIAFVNQYLLDQPCLSPLLTDINPDLTRLVNGISYLGNTSSFYNRIGKDTMFCKNPGLVEFNRRLTDYSQTFDQSFEQVSDRRCIELRNSHWIKPWVIMWSGGIDSTVIVASVLRNLPAVDFSNIKIWCTSGSIYENPRFFVDHILPNFEVINDPDMAKVYQVDDIFIIQGDPGMIWGMDYFNLKLENYGCGDLKWQHNRDQVISILSDGPEISVDYCNWMYNALAENIHSTGLPIDTLGDWFWWVAFNHMWGVVNLMDINQYVPRIGRNSTILNNKVNWFDSDGYQQWIIRNFKNFKRRFDKTDLKEYIYTVSDDVYYLKFKRKIRSNQRKKYNAFIYDRSKTPEQYAYLARDHYFCILENLEFLYLDTDFDRIVELLPDHFNLDSLQYLE